jgi:hypothetical protein
VFLERGGARAAARGGFFGGHGAILGRAAAVSSAAKEAEF